MPPRHCNCPRDGSRLCIRCQTLLERAQGQSQAMPETPEPFVTEKAFQGAVMRLADLGGFLSYHTYSSRKSVPGFPDVVCVRGPEHDAQGMLVHPGELLFAELKTLEGVLTLAQQRWLSVLGQATVVEAHVWSPADMPAIKERLAPRPTP